MSAPEDLVRVCAFPWPTRPMNESATKVQPRLSRRSISRRCAPQVRRVGPPLPIDFLELKPGPVPSTHAHVCVRFFFAIEGGLRRLFCTCIPRCHCLVGPNLIPSSNEHSQADGMACGSFRMNFLQFGGFWQNIALCLLLSDRIAKQAIGTMNFFSALEFS